MIPANTQTNESGANPVHQGPLRRHLWHSSGRCGHPSCHKRPGPQTRPFSCRLRRQFIFRASAGRIIRLGYSFRQLNKWAGQWLFFCTSFQNESFTSGFPYTGSLYLKITILHIYRGLTEVSLIFSFFPGQQQISPARLHLFSG